MIPFGKAGKMTFLSALIVCALMVCYWSYTKWKYPYGYSHCCDKQLMFALLAYADEHNGNYPSGEATPEASLSLLYPKYAAAYLLCGKTVPVEKADEILKRGERLGPESCGWHYVEGLKNNEATLGLVWDKVGGLGHWGDQLSDGGRTVIMANGHFRYVSGQEWSGFLEEQERMIAAKKKK